MDSTPARGYNTCMYKRFFFFLSLLLLLSACSLGSGSGQPTSDLVGTQVSLILTSTASSNPTQPPLSATIPPVVVTVTPTIEFTATATITPTSTELVNPVSALGAPTWSSSLDSVSSWYTEDNDYSNIRGENGALLLTSKQAVGWHSWSMHYHSLKNFYLEASIKTGTCSSNDLYGLIFRAPDTSTGYFLSLTCDGRVGLRAFDGSEFTNVSEFIQSPSILAGSNQSNKLGVLANGDTLSLFVNNQKVTEVTDSTFSSGTFGVFISAINTPGFQIALEDISYWMLP